MSLHSEAYDVIAAQIAAQFGKSTDELSESTEFESDLGFKSVNYVLLSSSLEDEFEVEIPYMDLKRSKTLGDAADFVAGQLEQ